MKKSLKLRAVVLPSPAIGGVSAKAFNVGLRFRDGRP
jgi:hypothetical protein